MWFLIIREKKYAQNGITKGEREMVHFKAIQIMIIYISHITIKCARSSTIWQEFILHRVTTLPKRVSNYKESNIRISSFQQHIVCLLLNHFPICKYDGLPIQSFLKFYCTNTTSNQSTQENNSKIPKYNN